MGREKSVRRRSEIEWFGGFSNTFEDEIYWSNVSPRWGMKNWCTVVEGMSRGPRAESWLGWLSLKFFDCRGEFKRLNFDCDCQCSKTPGSGVLASRLLLNLLWWRRPPEVSPLDLEGSISVLLLSPYFKFMCFMFRSLWFSFRSTTFGSWTKILL